MSFRETNAWQDPLTRRDFLERSGSGLGVAALASLFGEPAAVAAEPGTSGGGSGLDGGLHLPARVKRVIYLFMAGGPSHMDLFDPKPKLQASHGQPLPPSVRAGERLTLMTRNQKEHLCAGTVAPFVRCGKSGMELSTLLPHTAKVADDLCVIRSMFTEPINHDPAVTFMQTGSQDAGRPSLGSWLSYGLGSENANLPNFVVLLSGHTIQPLLSRYWHSGFLPSRHQGVQFRSPGDPVLFLSNPEGYDHRSRGRVVDAVNTLNRQRYARVLDPEIQARIDSFELAYRMQTSVPELMDIAAEPTKVRELYGAGPTQDGKASFANNCLLARRLVERGVRFVQLYHAGWDQHNNLAGGLARQCEQTDRASSALIQDLKQRGMLDDTLIIWGGEFGRTSYSQGAVTSKNYGRDHHNRCFTVWMAGGGVRGGLAHGATDDFAYRVAEDPVHTHDLQATILHLLGIDHERLVYRFKGRDFRLTDVHGQVVEAILS